MSYKSYNIITSPLLQHGGYGVSIKNEDDEINIYFIGGPKRVKNGYPDFGPSQKLQHTALHEFGHSFVNPTTEKFRKEINQYVSLYKPIKKIMKKQAYGSWETCVNEHIIRAITTRLTSLQYGENAENQWKLFEKSKGFFYLPNILEKLKYYEANRDVYPSFENFYPEFINVFKDLFEQELSEDFYELKFHGDVSSIFFDPDNFICITPTNEKDPDLIKELIHDCKNDWGEIPTAKMRLAFSMC